MLSLGLIAEMLAAEASRGAVSYSVLERTEFPHSPTGSKSEELPAMGEGTGEA